MVTERLQRQNERLLDEAENAVADLKWDLVRDRALAVLAFDPDNADAKEFLSAAQRASGMPPSVTPSIPLEQDSPVSSIEESPQTISSSSQRYQLKHLLSQDDQKQVFLATDSLLHRDVAFTLINTESLEEASRSRIKREALAMARLGSHPHIVTLFHIGEHPSPGIGEATQPFIASELMDGGNLAGVIQVATQHRLPLDQTVIIAQEICQGLDFAHNGGIVHGDLNPGNVWLNSDGVAKIADFGLHVVADRFQPSAMTPAAVSYMAPEKVSGGAASASSDLYSLGAILYEMVTGRPPFLGEDASTIIGHHINTPPVDPSWHNLDCPLALQDLIMRLLAKDPAERPDSAAQVLEALASVDFTVTVESSQAVEDQQPHDPNALVGRQRELAELQSLLHDALAGQGRLATLVGEPGVGKSRTAAVLAAYAQSQGALVLRAHCFQPQSFPPYYPWAQAIRSYVQEQDPDYLLSQFGAGVVAHIAELVSEIQSMLPDLSPPPHVESPEQARSRFFDSISAFFKSAAHSQPLLLLLEDLHWADLPSLLLLQFVARDLAGSRILVLGTYSDSALSRHHPLADTLKELTQERLVHRVLLRGLSEEEVGQLINVVSAIDPSPSLARAVFTQTEGNPLFVSQVVQQLMHEGGLSRERTTEGDSWTVRINEGIGEVIWRRLNRLSRECKETLTAAAFVGREFSLQQLNPLMEDLTQDQLLNALEEAVAAQVIQELPEAVGRYQFTHSLLQESLIQELPDSGRVMLHARIARALEDLYAPNLEEHAFELAYHFGQAENVIGSEQLGHYSLIAGEQALAIHTWESALGHFRRALAAKEGQPTDGETAAILFGLARSMCANVDKFQLNEIVAHLTRVFRYFEQSGVISGRAMLDFSREST